MTTSPQSPVPGRPYTEPGRGYAPAADRQPVRITGTVRTKPAVWRIAWGVCLGLLMYSLITTIVAIVLLLVFGYDLVDRIQTATALGDAVTTLAGA